MFVPSLCGLPGIEWTGNGPVQPVLLSHRHPPLCQDKSRKEYTPAVHRRSVRSPSTRGVEVTGVAPEPLAVSRERRADICQPDAARPPTHRTRCNARTRCAACQPRSRCVEPVRGAEHRARWQLPSGPWTGRGTDCAGCTSEASGTGRHGATRERGRSYSRICRSGRRWVTLEVPGRRSGKITRFPLGMADLDGRWYLVSMLGDCNWTRNVRAAHGHAHLVRGRKRRPVVLDEIPVADRPPILKRYLEKVPGGRPHIPVDRHEPVEAFAAVADRYPFLRVTFSNPACYGSGVRYPHPAGKIHPRRARHRRPYAAARSPGPGCGRGARSGRRRSPCRRPPR